MKGAGLFHAAFTLFCNVAVWLVFKPIWFAAVTALMCLGVPAFIVGFPLMCGICGMCAISSGDWKKEEAELRMFYSDLLSRRFWFGLYGIKKKPETDMKVGSAVSEIDAHFAAIQRILYLEERADLVDACIELNHTIGNEMENAEGRHK